MIFIFLVFLKSIVVNFNEDCMSMKILLFLLLSLFSFFLMKVLGFGSVDKESNESLYLMKELCCFSDLESCFLSLVLVKKLLFCLYMIVIFCFLKCLIIVVVNFIWMLMLVFSSKSGCDWGSSGDGEMVVDLIVIMGVLVIFLNFVMSFVFFNVNVVMIFCILLCLMSLIVVILNGIVFE